MRSAKYNIIRCPHCKTLQYVKIGQKLRRCPICGKTLQLSKITVITKARNHLEASTLVRYLKAKEAGLAEDLYEKGKTI